MKAIILSFCLLSLPACSRKESEADDKSLAAAAAKLDNEADADVTRMISKIEIESSKDDPAPKSGESVKSTN